MIYAYKCRACGHQVDAPIRTDRLGDCTHCAGVLTRLYLIRTTPPIEPHFNRTTGTIISSHREFSEQLKRSSEEYTLRTGIEARFAPVDPLDARAVGVTNEGLDATNRARVARGLPAVEVD